MSVAEFLDVNREGRKTFALKAERTLHRITFNPSSANPGETLYVHLPKLSENMVFVPNSVGLTFDITLEAVASASADVNRRIVNNISRNLVSRMKVLYGGEILQDTNRMDLFATYKDLFLSKQERENMLREGVSSVDIIKHRTAAGDKGSDAKDIALAKVYGTKYRLALNHPVIDEHGVFNHRALNHSLSFEITLPESKQICVNAAKKDYNYSLSNIELEYKCIHSDRLAENAKIAYRNKGFYYENILLHKTFNITKGTDTIINEHINVPRRSMSGIMILFIEPFTGGARDSEKFVYPNLTNVSINVDGMPNKVYSRGMQKTDFWDSITAKFGVTNNLTQKDFYAGDKFALWIDLRTHPSDELHGGGLMMNSTKDGVKLEIKRTATGSGTLNCYVFVVADAVMTIMNSDLKDITY